MGEVKTFGGTRIGAAPSRYPRPVRLWLLVGLVMVVGQIVIGGITRLTESGLSITEWKPLSGAMPPMNAADWQSEFEKYRASPQFEKIFADISMDDFKFIYFWEWFHRQWARFMGLVFAVGFVVFWRKGWLGGPLMRRLGVVVLLAALAASFGWIMVASGLIDRPWVNAYKLTIHLSLGILLFSYLLWTILKVNYPQGRTFPHTRVEKWIWPLNIVLAAQLILGGIMSGAKAALPFPTWPDMNGHFIPPVLKDAGMWTVENMVYYEATLFQPALIQFLHRLTAYALVIIVFAYLFQVFRAGLWRELSKVHTLLIILLITQVLLGIATVVSSQGQVPVGLGVAHQLGAILLVGTVVWLNHRFRPGTPLLPVDKTVEKAA
ncbi:COX15/CtaA family protein [Neolewinella lacunae]|uniref:COX15/CtaA family protein n=1 Tax=Neolewinella lacunae TaxID=1517758 RepID=A0A923PN95_9BACT|nr:COX15/CtaA family protein [Neolewinella lacunae]MBC6995841.1 COX15/CtaA family protein [Neolewinella lacunae]MDN3636466.1 COX15/CtaA family protein [Neolewinella lacunae]